MKPPLYLAVAVPILIVEKARFDTVDVLDYEK
jgi:hypothetical protein